MGQGRVGVPGDLQVCSLKQQTAASSLSVSIEPCAPLQPRQKESLWLFPGAKTDSQAPGPISTVCISVCREKVGVRGKRVNCLRAVQHLSQFCLLQA